MHALSEEYKDAPVVEPRVDPEQDAVYLHTSSATGPHNLKCVPISHRVLAKRGLAVLEVANTRYPQETYSKLRVLGWSSCMLFDHPRLRRTNRADRSMQSPI